MGLCNIDLCQAHHVQLPSKLSAIRPCTAREAPEGRNVVKQRRHPHHSHHLHHPHPLPTTTATATASLSTHHSAPPAHTETMAVRPITGVRAIPRESQRWGGWTLGRETRANTERRRVRGRAERNGHQQTPADTPTPDAPPGPHHRPFHRARWVSRPFTPPIPEGQPCANHHRPRLAGLGFIGGNAFWYGYHMPRTNARDKFYQKLEEERAAKQGA